MDEKVDFEPIEFEETNQNEPIQFEESVQESQSNIAPTPGLLIGGALDSLPVEKMVEKGMVNTAGVAMTPWRDIIRLDPAIEEARFMSENPDQFNVFGQKNKPNEVLQNLGRVGTTINQGEADLNKLAWQKVNENPFNVDINKAMSGAITKSLTPNEDTGQKILNTYTPEELEEVRLQQIEQQQKYTNEQLKKAQSKIEKEADKKYNQELKRQASKKADDLIRQEKLTRQISPIEEMKLRNELEIDIKNNPDKYGVDSNRLSIDQLDAVKSAEKNAGDIKLQELIKADTTDDFATLASEDQPLSNRQKFAVKNENLLNKDIIPTTREQKIIEDYAQLKKQSTLTDVQQKSINKQSKVTANEIISSMKAPSSSLEDYQKKQQIIESIVNNPQEAGLNLEDFKKVLSEYKKTRLEDEAKNIKKLDLPSPEVTKTGDIAKKYPDLAGVKVDSELKATINKIEDITSNSRTLSSSELQQKLKDLTEYQKKLDKGSTSYNFLNNFLSNEVPTSLRGQRPEEVSKIFKRESDLIKLLEQGDEAKAYDKDFKTISEIDKREASRQTHLETNEKNIDKWLDDVSKNPDAVEILNKQGMNIDDLRKSIKASNIDAKLLPNKLEAFASLASGPFSKIGIAKLGANIGGRAVAKAAKPVAKFLGKFAGPAGMIAAGAFSYNQAYDALIEQGYTPEEARQTAAEVGGVESINPTPLDYTQAMINYKGSKKKGESTVEALGKGALGSVEYVPELLQAVAKDIPVTQDRKGSFAQLAQVQNKAIINDDTKPKFDVIMDKAESDVRFDKFRGMLDKYKDTPDADKERAMFGLMQQPGFRQLIKKDEE